MVYRLGIFFSEEVVAVVMAVSGGGGVRGSSRVPLSIAAIKEHAPSALKPRSPIIVRAHL